MDRKLQTADQEPSMERPAVPRGRAGRRCERQTAVGVAAYAKAGLR